MDEEESQEGTKINLETMKASKLIQVHAGFSFTETEKMEKDIQGCVRFEHFKPTSMMLRPLIHYAAPS